MEELIRYRVTGRVQGVFFRDCTCGAAGDAGVTGWVRNNPDGSVVGEAWGGTAAIDRFVSWLHRGSPHSRVDAVELLERREAPNPFDRFETRY
jgi:acylphosphatase